MARAVSAAASKTGGDDLDDDLLISSGAEDDKLEDVDNGGAFEEDGLVRSPPAKVDEASSSAEEPGTGSRKRRASTEASEDEANRKAEKKRRKKEKEKLRKAKKQDGIAASLSLTPPTHCTPSEISELLLASIGETFPAASPLEIDDLIIPEDRLLSPADYPPTPSNTDPFAPLVSRIESLLNPLQSKKLRPSTPRIIILALSGLRCADIVRGVRDVKGQGEVAKLFAKHFKLVEQVAYLKKTRVSVAVGTPARVGKLLEAGAIKVTSDTVLLLDVGHRDSKTRTLLTLPEARTELWKTVFSGKSREKLFNGARIGAF